MIYWLFVALLYVSIFVAGINQDTIGISILISFVASCLGLVYLNKSTKDIKIPKNFGAMTLFVIILHVYLFFISDKLNPFYYATIMGEGLIFWLIFYNIDKGGEVLKSLLINLSLIYSVFYISSILFKINLIALANPFFNGGLLTRHWNIGDLWAFALVALISLNWGRFKLSSWLTSGIGFAFIAISGVRSAMLSLIIGLIYFFSKKMISTKPYTIIKTVLVLVSIGLFIYSGISKTTLFDRPYYFQSIQSFPKHPLGVGMGNFKDIAAEYHEQGIGGGHLAINTFNIFFETLSGVGIFSIIFLIFLISTFRELLKGDTQNMAWGAVVMTILVNFMTDASYTIPALMWILFMSLGVFQSRQKSLADS